MNESLRRYTPAAYAVAAYFILVPVADIATNAWPWNFTNEQWRYGLAGITANYLVSVLFGALLAGLFAAAHEHRLLLRVLGIALLVAAVLQLVMVLGLVLDTFQIQGMIQGDERTMLRIGATKAGFKIGASAVLMIVIAIACFRAARDAGAVRSQSGPLIRPA